MIPENSPEMSPTTVRPGPGWVLTIEFGDEHTFAAVRHPGRGTRPVRLGADRDSMPSGVFVGPREMFAGERAAVAGRTEPEWYVAEPRRWIGNETARLGNGSSVPVVQLVAAVLRQVAWAATAGQDAGAARGGGAGPPRRLAPLPGRAAGPRRPAGRAGPGPARLRATGRADPGRSRVAGRVRQVGGVGPGRRSRRRVLALVAAATACVAVLAAGAVWITAGSSAEPGPPPVPVSAPARPTSADPVAAPTPDPSPATAGPASDAVPAELAATFPDLGDSRGPARRRGCWDASRRDTANFGGGAGVAQPTYAAMCTGPRRAERREWSSPGTRTCSPVRGTCWPTARSTRRSSRTRGGT